MADVPSSSAKSVHAVDWASSIVFTLNGQSLEVADPDPCMLLIDYLHSEKSLFGAKQGCNDGSCGSCTVMVEDLAGNVIACNACALLLCSCDGCSITTVEGLSAVEGDLPGMQQSLLDHLDGSECGYCLAGWTMAMQAALHTARREDCRATANNFGNVFDGNVCTCTGYLPFAQAFSSQCDRACQREDRGSHAVDIEELRECHINQASGHDITFTSGKTPRPLLISHGGRVYCRPVRWDQLCAVLDSCAEQAQEVSILAGMHCEDAVVVVDVNALSDMQEVRYHSSCRKLSVGAAVSIARLISALTLYARRDEQHHSVFAVTAEHLSGVSSQQVRNAKSWSADLLGYLQNEPSELVLTLTIAKVIVQLCDTKGAKVFLPMADFLEVRYADLRARGLFVVSMAIQEAICKGSVMETSMTMYRGMTNCGVRLHVIADTPEAVPTCTSARIAVCSQGATNRVIIATRTERTVLYEPLTMVTLGKALKALDEDLQEAGAAPSMAAHACLYHAFLRAYGQLPSNLQTVLLPWKLGIGVQRSDSDDQRDEQPLVGESADEEAPSAVLLLAMLPGHLDHITADAVAVFTAADLPVLMGGEVSAGMPIALIIGQQSVVQVNMSASPPGPAPHRMWTASIAPPVCLSPVSATASVVDGCLDIVLCGCAASPEVTAALSRLLALPVEQVHVRAEGSVFAYASKGMANLLAMLVGLAAWKLPQLPAVHLQLSWDEQRQLAQGMQAVWEVDYALEGSGMKVDVWSNCGEEEGMMPQTAYDLDALLGLQIAFHHPPAQSHAIADSGMLSSLLMTHRLSCLCASEEVHVLQERCLLPDVRPLWTEAMALADYHARYQRIVAYNIDSLWRKLGLSISVISAGACHAVAVSEVEVNVLSGGQMHVRECLIVLQGGQDVLAAVRVGLAHGLEQILGTQLLAVDMPKLTVVPLQGDGQDLQACYQLGRLAGCAVYSALQMAIASARKDAGHEEPFALPVPAAAEERLGALACCLNKERYVLPA